MKLLYNFTRFGLSPEKILRRMFPVNDLPKLLSLSIPKSGTHLLQRILLLHPDIYRPLAPTLGQRNIKRWKSVERLASKIKPGQLYSSHFLYSKEAENALIKNNIRTIFLVRDPRAVLISGIYYVMNIRNHPSGKYFVTLPDMKSRIMVNLIGDAEHSTYPFKQLFSRFQEWADSPATLCFKFEDLVGSAGGGTIDSQIDAISRIYHYAGLKASPELIEHVAKNAFSTDSPTFRSGKIDGWRQYFDEDVQEAFKEHTGDLLVDLGYEESNNWKA